MNIVLLVCCYKKIVFKYKRRSYRCELITIKSDYMFLFNDLKNNLKKQLISL